MDLDQRVLGAISDVLAHNTTLQTLDLSGCRFNARSVARLMKGLQQGCRWLAVAAGQQAAAAR